MTQFRLTCNILFLLLLLVVAAATFVLYNTNRVRATVLTTIRPLYTPQDNYSPESDEPTRIAYQLISGQPSETPRHVSVMLLSSATRMFAMTRLCLT